MRWADPLLRRGSAYVVSLSKTGRFEVLKGMKGSKWIDASVIALIGSFFFIVVFKTL
jgi:hypothetical protein